MVRIKDYKPKITHKDLQQNVVDLAKLKGWRIQFWWRSFHSPSGFPDLIILRTDDQKLLFVELKIPPDRMNPSQQEWLDDLSKIKGVKTYVWTDKDWLNGTIEKILE